MFPLLGLRVGSNYWPLDFGGVVKESDNKSTELIVSKCFSFSSSSSSFFPLHSLFFFSRIKKDARTTRKIDRRL